MYVSVLEGGLGGALGVDGGWLPLPTRPQRYCDPASLVDMLEQKKIYQIFFLILYLLIFIISL